MPGLSFLGKKSWHTSNIDNVEKVWLAEQKADQEKKKVAELQKQISEERQIQELRQLQVQSGHSVKAVDTTLDWMYEGPAGKMEKSAEDYLLGKIYKPPADEKSDMHKIAKDPGSLWLNKVSSKNDTFTRLHEDPLLMIKKTEKNSRDNILNNPVKMAKIQRELMSQLESKNLEKKLKKEKKEKKEKKHKKDKKEKHEKYENNSKDSHESKYKDNSIEVLKKRTDLLNSDRNNMHPNKKQRNGDTDSNLDGNTKQKYGLIKGKESQTKNSQTYFGPNPELLALKEAENNKKVNELKNRGRNDLKSLSEGERLKRLSEMQKDAEMYDSVRDVRIHDEIKIKQNESVNDVTNLKQSATFIKDMRDEVYIKSNDKIEDRLKQNRHYMQKETDIEKHGFLKR